MKFKGLLLLILFCLVTVDGFSRCIHRPNSRFRCFSCSAGRIVQFGAAVAVGVGQALMGSTNEGQQLFGAALTLTGTMILDTDRQHGGNHDPGISAALAGFCSGAKVKLLRTRVKVSRIEINLLDILLNFMMVTSQSYFL